MANSRAKISTTTQAGVRSIATKATRAAVTKILSTSGSINLPKVVTKLRLRARWPSTKSVQAATMNSSPASKSAAQPCHKDTTSTNTGTIKKRTIVTLLGKFILCQRFIFAIPTFFTIKYTP